MAEIAMREAYGLALAEYGSQHPQVVALDVDTSVSTLTSFLRRVSRNASSTLALPNPAWWM